MSVVCVAWSSHVGALMSAASRPGMPSVRVLSSRMLEEPDGVERCLETMRPPQRFSCFGQQTRCGISLMKASA